VGAIGGVVGDVLRIDKKPHRKPYIPLILSELNKSEDCSYKNYITQDHLFVCFIYDM